MKTRELVIPAIGTVLVHYKDDWSGNVTIEWHDNNTFHRVTLPIEIIDRVSSLAKKSKTTRSRHERDRKLKP